MEERPRATTPPSGGEWSVGQGQRRSSSRGSGDEDGDAEEEESSSSSPSNEEESQSAQSALENFRRQWENELKKTINNANSALNLVTASPQSLANRYPNPTSMAGAVGGSPSHHPFAKEGSSIVSIPTVSSSGYDDSNVGTANQEIPSSGTLEEQAKRWFLQGVGFERHGDLYDAVRCYRRAVQLVPDIEYRVSKGLLEEESKNEDLDSDDSGDEEGHILGDGRGNNENQEGDEDDGDLMRKFLHQIEQRKWAFFQKLTENGKTHIGDLPVEVISYILRWVVSSDLDVRSLDIASCVCKGFYCIARDDKLWQMACAKVWVDCVLDSAMYDSYRDMFLRRPRVRLDGCYISKVTYIRAGENSFQDQFYRPWHFVEYYRYIRFLPDGRVHFLTTAEAPTTALAGLRDKTPRYPGTLSGTYQLYGNNTVSFIVSKPSSPTSTIGGFSRAKQRQENHQQTSFHIELKICDVKGRHNWMLKWSHHSVFLKKIVTPQGRNLRQNANLNNQQATVTSTAFDLCSTKYPPLLFSRVRSFTGKSERILG